MVKNKAGLDKTTTNKESRNRSSVKPAASSTLFLTQIIVITNPIYVLNTLEPTLEPKNELRRQWRGITEKQFEQRLKTVNYKIEESTFTFTAIAGSQRVESSETSEEVTEEAINAINALLDVVESRVAKLKAIRRSQRADLEVQVRYYCNGMFEGYYEEEGSELADPDGAPRQGSQSDSAVEPALSEPPTTAVPQENDEAEVAFSRGDEDEDESGDNGGSQRTCYHRGDDDDDDDSEGGQYPSDDRDEEDEDEHDNYSRRQSRRQEGYDYGDDE